MPKNPGKKNNPALGHDVNAVNYTGMEINETIGIRPQAGLANRMRALHAALQLSETLQSSLTVHWVKTPDFNCSYNQLFKSPNAFRLIESSSLIRDNGRAQKILISLMQGMRINCPRNYQQYLFHKVVREYLDNHISFLKFKGKSVYIQTDALFFKFGQAFTSFEPVHEIQNIIDTFCLENLQPSFIGIHIRRADHIKAIKYSPTSLFINRIGDELKKNPGQKFYLSTDSVEEEYNLKKHFGTNIICRKKELSRATSQGIKDALVDMFILSRSREIWGSYYSSFSEIAATLGGIPLHVLVLEEENK